MPDSLRPAATVALLRDHPKGMQVFLLKRSRGSPFMPSAHVFPGGRVDPQDAECPVQGGQADRDRMGETFGAPAQAYQVAAVRETYEESGVLLARGQPDPELRAALQAGTLSIHQAALQAGWVLELSGLVYFAWWITPKGETRRYDTRFFAAHVQGGEQAVHDDYETVASAWATPAQWLQSFDLSEVMLAPPTWRTLLELAEFDSAAQAIAALRRQDVVPIEPRGRATETGFVVLLPGDPEYPSERPVSGPTRHELRDGRWLIHR